MVSVYVFFLCLMICTISHPEKLFLICHLDLLLFAVRLWSEVFQNPQLALVLAFHTRSTIVLWFGIESLCQFTPLFFLWLRLVFFCLFSCRNTWSHLHYKRKKGWQSQFITPRNPRNDWQFHRQSKLQWRFVFRIRPWISL